MQYNTIHDTNAQHCLKHTYTYTLKQLYLQTHMYKHLMFYTNIPTDTHNIVKIFQL